MGLPSSSALSALTGVGGAVLGWFVREVRRSADFEELLVRVCPSPVSCPTCPCLTIEGVIFWPVTGALVVVPLPAFFSLVFGGDLLFGLKRSGGRRYGIVRLAL